MCYATQGIFSANVCDDLPGTGGAADAGKAHSIWRDAGGGPGQSLVQPRAFGLKPREADKERGKEKARQKGTEKLNYGGEKEDTTKSRRHGRG